MTTIHLLVAGRGDSALLAHLSAHLRQTLVMPVEVEAPLLSLDFAHDPSRGQYHATMLLRELANYHLPRHSRLLALTEVDLFIPILTFVFGEAELGGRNAIISAFRLRSEFYGLPGDDSRLRERLSKEAIHELGHTFGLVHCPQPDCVMRSATYVEEIDLKSERYCLDCLSVIAKMRS